MDGRGDTLTVAELIRSLLPFPGSATVIIEADVLGLEFEIKNIEFRDHSDAFAHTAGVYITVKPVEPTSDLPVIVPEES